MLVRTLCAGLSDLTAVLINHVSTDAEGAEHLDRAITHLPALTNVDATQATVQTEVQLPNRPMVIEYRMHRKEGAWKIIDVTFGDVSLVSTYRLSFGPVVRRHGMEALIEQIAEKNKQRAGA